MSQKLLSPFAAGLSLGLFAAGSAAVVLLVSFDFETVRDRNAVLLFCTFSLMAGLVVLGIAAAMSLQAIRGDARRSGIV